MITSLIKKVFTYLFPAQCIICAELSETNLCNDCLNSVEFATEQNLPWALSLYSYKDETMKDIVRHLKNFPDREIVDQLLRQGLSQLLEWFKPLIDQFPNHTFVCLPVPLHTSRFTERGYNQTDYIAQSFISTLQDSIPNTSLHLNQNLLRKIKLTKKQALIKNREERFNNIANAFSVDIDFLPKNLDSVVFIIVDDISTTGGTLTEIRKILEPYNTKIFGFTLGH
jgi:ComF family protein